MVSGGRIVSRKGANGGRHRPRARAHGRSSRLQGRMAAWRETLTVDRPVIPADPHPSGFGSHRRRTEKTVRLRMRCGRDGWMDGSP